MCLHQDKTSGWHHICIHVLNEKWIKLGNGNEPFEHILYWYTSWMMSKEKQIAEIPGGHKLWLVSF